MGYEINKKNQFQRKKVGKIGEKVGSGGPYLA